MHPWTLALHLGAMATLLAACWQFQRLLARKHRWSLRSAALGAATFVIAARVLEPLALHATGITALIGRPGATLWWLIPALAAAAALFEEFGRLVSLGVLRRHPGSHLALVWSFAVGYAVVELLFVGIFGHGQLLALASSGEVGSKLLQELPPEARTALQRSLDGLGPTSALWLLNERLAACAFQVALTVLVAAAIESRSVVRFCAALALHFMIDLPAAAYQLGEVPLWLVEVAYAVAGIGALRVLVHCWQAGQTGLVQPKQVP